EFWPLVVIAFVGTLNPSSGDVSLFLPLEHAAISDSVAAERRTAVFGRYSLVGALVGAAGSYASALPQVMTGRVDPLVALQLMFVLYGLIGIATLGLYRVLPRGVDAENQRRQAPLRESRRIVLILAALFSIDAFGGGLVVQSLLAGWLIQRFDLSLAGAATIFFWSGVLAAGSFPVAVWLAQRIWLLYTTGL